MSGDPIGDGQARVRTYAPGRTRGTAGRLAELREYRQFMLDQFRRRVRTRYNRSVLGWAWSVITPIATLLIYTLVFGTILQGHRNLVPNPDGLTSFGHFLFSAMVVWFVFQQASTGVLSAFIQSMTLRKRLYFPPVAPVFAAFAAGLVGNLMELLVLVVAFVSVGSVAPTFLGLLLVLPLSAMFALGVGMSLATLNGRYRDVGHLYEVVLRLLFFCTPIIYTIDIVPETYGGLPLRDLMYLNPLTWFTEASRSLAFQQQWPSAGSWLVMAGCVLAAMGSGWWIFHRFADDVIEGF